MHEIGISDLCQITAPRGSGCSEMRFQASEKGIAPILTDENVTRAVVKNRPFLSMRDHHRIGTSRISSTNATSQQQPSQNCRFPGSGD